MSDLDTSRLRTWAEIDLNGITHNLNEIRKLVGNTKILSVVKANAYGLGAVPCAKALRANGIDMFAVAEIEEAIELRKAGIEEPIMIFGYTMPARFQDLKDYDLIQTIVDYDYGKEMNEWAKENDTVLKGHIKLDTGMNRTGFLIQDQADELEQVADVYNMDHLDVQGIFSHFPVSDELDEPSLTFTKKQIERFNDAIERLKAKGINPGLRHIQNSYGILNYQDLGMDYCRPGLLYHGITSDDQIETVAKTDFRSILTIKTKISMVKTIEKGATVSYGRHYTADGPRKIASLCIGYADGLPRACSNKGLEVLIHGKKAPIVGNICMDQCMADVTDIDDVKEGDTAIVVGEENGEKVTMDQISRLAGTINNETMTRMGNRIKRFYFFDGRL